MYACDTRVKEKEAAFSQTGNGGVEGLERCRALPTVLELRLPSPRSNLPMSCSMEFDSIYKETI